MNCDVIITRQMAPSTGIIQTCNMLMGCPFNSNEDHYYVTKIEYLRLLRVEAGYFLKNNDSFLNLTMVYS